MATSKRKKSKWSKHSALLALQDEVWASLSKYSVKLGWGLTGIQPECWTLLDGAVNELASLREQFCLTWDQNMGHGRGESQELRGTRYAIWAAWANLCRDALPNSVRNVRVYRNGQKFDPLKGWPA